MLDKYNRNIDYMRISVTDRCNLRCRYCMPYEGVDDISHDEILNFDEIITLTEIFSNLGIKKIKITGGEPLVRKNIFSLIRQIKDLEKIEQVTITSNALLLRDKVDEFFKSGLDGINISLDTLKSDKYSYITRGGNISHVLSTIDQLYDRSFKNIKINTVLISGFNDDEIIDLALLAKDRFIQVRFIELMPIGYAKNLKAISSEKILEILRQRFDEPKLVKEKLGNGPASYYKFEGFKGSIGFISPVNHKFCDSCNRLRLTSSGFLKLCLQYNIGLDLKKYLRRGYDSNFIEKIIRRNVFEFKPLENSFNKDFASFNMNEIGG